MHACRKKVHVETHRYRVVCRTILCRQRAQAVRLDTGGLAPARPIIFLNVEKGDQIMYTERIYSVYTTESYEIAGILLEMINMHEMVYISWIWANNYRLSVNFGAELVREVCRCMDVYRVSHQ